MWPSTGKQKVYLTCGTAPAQLDCKPARSKGADYGGFAGFVHLNPKKHSGRCAFSEVKRLERKIAATDAEIDDFIFMPYFITAEEDKIIEGAGP